MRSDQYREKWQARWMSDKPFATSYTYDKKPYYILDMFPYPSGSGLHVGHAVGYVATDIIARRKRMEGFNVLHPMGWDAFGLPAEQYAIKHGVHPAKVTAQNCENFKRQLMLMGLSYDWTREINTSDPKYYRWTQYLFLKLYERGLVYQKQENVWWCEALKTVLANEEVIDGRSERGDHPCIRKPLNQWVVRITAYADRLLDGLHALDWPESVKKMQREWIGRTEGIELDIGIFGLDGKSLTVFVPNPESLFDMKAVLLSIQHPLVPEMLRAMGRSVEGVMPYMVDLRIGVNGILLGRSVIHPLCDITLPIILVNYTPDEYSDEASLCCPDGGDEAMALIKRFDLEEEPSPERLDLEAELKWLDDQYLPGRLSQGELVEKYLSIKNNARRTVRYRMRDWLFSRQRYWGEPFPLYRDADGNITMADVNELPIELPLVDSYAPSSDGTSPLQRQTEWTNCTSTSGAAQYRVTDTMPGWAGSCWYFLRFMDPMNAAAPFSRGSADYWNQVDLYVGGAAHATMHLLYARFWHKVLFDCGLVGCDEPFKRLFNQGLVTADAFRDNTGRVVPVDEVESREGIYRIRGSLSQVEVFNTKMSKSLLNVVTPDEVIREYGVDTFRIYMMFIGPLGQNKKWSSKGIKGCQRFLSRVFAIFTEEADAAITNSGTRAAQSEAAIKKGWAKALTKVDAAFVSLNFNTAIAAFMEFINQAEKDKDVFLNCVGRDFLRALFPFAPHICSEIWERRGESKLDYAGWPVVQLEAPSAARIYVNGKQIDELTGGGDDQEVDVERARIKVKEVIGLRDVTKVIYVPGRVINFLCQ